MPSDKYYFATRSNNKPKSFWALRSQTDAVAYGEMLSGQATVVWTVVPKPGAKSFKLADLRDKHARAIFDKVNARRVKENEATIPENRWPRMATLDLLEREDWIESELRKICDYVVLTDYAHGKHEAIFVVRPTTMEMVMAARTANTVVLVRKLVKAARMLIIGRTVTMDWEDFGERDLLGAPIDATLFVDAPDRPSQGGNPAMAIQVAKDEISKIDDDPEIEVDLLVAARDELGFAVEWADNDWEPTGNQLTRVIQPTSKDTTFRYLL